MFFVTVCNKVIRQGVHMQEEDYTEDEEDYT